MLFSTEIRRLQITETGETLLFETIQYPIFKLSDVHSVILTIYCAGF